MSRWARAAAALVIGLAFATPSAAFGLASTGEITKSPNSPSSSDLVTQQKAWDGKSVTFTGEAVAGAMRRGDNAWIHINDDAYYLRNVEEGAPLGGYNSGHAVWLDADLADKVTNYGDYTHEGDVVTVRGTFNAACGQHGGDMDIHADALDVVRPGHVVHEPIRFGKLGFGVALLLMAALLWAANRRTSNLELFGVIAPRRH